MIVPLALGGMTTPQYGFPPGQWVVDRVPLLKIRPVGIGAGSEETGTTSWATSMSSGTATAAAPSSAAPAMPAVVNKVRRDGDQLMIEPFGAF